MGSTCAGRTRRKVDPSLCTDVVSQGTGNQSHRNNKISRAKPIYQQNSQNSQQTTQYYANQSQQRAAEQTQTQNELQNDLNRAQDVAFTQPYTPPLPGPTTEGSNEINRAIREALWTDSERNAAYAFLDKVDPISIKHNVEFYTFVVCQNCSTENTRHATIGFGVGDAGTGTSGGFEKALADLKAALSPNMSIEATAHTHGAPGPGPDENFSYGDAQTTNAYGINAYLGTPQGDFRVLQPGDVPNPQPHQSYPGTLIGPLPPSRAYGEQ